LPSCSGGDIFSFDAVLPDEAKGSAGGACPTVVARNAAIRRFVSAYAAEAYAAEAYAAEAYAAEAYAAEAGRKS
jgi:hypothetical protein